MILYSIFGGFRLKRVILNIGSESSRPEMYHTEKLLPQELPAMDITLQLIHFQTSIG